MIETNSINPLQQPSVPTEAADTPSLIEKISNIFKSIQIWFEELGMKFDHWLADSKFFSERTIRHIFGENAYYAGNYGSKKEIPRFVAGEPTEISERAKMIKEKYSLSKKEPLLNPYGDGVCFGACTLFCKDMLEKKAVESVKDSYCDGVSFEAVELQACYGSFKAISHFPKLTNQILGFLKDLSQLSDEDLHNTKNTFSSSVINSACISYELEKRSSSTPILIADSILKHYRQHPDFKELKPVTANCIIEAANSLSFDTQKNYDLNGNIEDRMKWRAGSLMGGLDVEQFILQEGAPKNMLEEAKNLTEGTFLFTIPVYSPIGTYSGDHCFAVYISAKETWLYDPNLALSKIEPGALGSVVSKLVENYTGYKSEPPKTKGASMLRALNRVKRFFLLESNPPLWGSIKSNFGIAKLALAPPLDQIPNLV